MTTNREKVWGVTTSFEDKLKKIQNEIEETKATRTDLLIEQANDVTELAQLDKYDLSPKDKSQYMYLVKPQLLTIKNMIEAGMPPTQIADALTVPHAALARMRSEVPELEEIFYLGKLSKIEMAEESMFMLSQQNITEEQMITKNGEIVTVQRVREPDFRAAKFILENHKSDEYSDKKVVVHQSEMGNDMQELLKQLDSATLEAILARHDAIDITETTEVSDSND